MNSKKARSVLIALYPMAALLVLVPLLEIGAGAWPFRPSMLSWRFGVLGIVFKSLVTPLLGISLAMGVGVALDHRRVVRALAVLNIVVAVSLVAAATVFGLDFVQLRATLPAEMRTGVDLASVIALAIAGMAFPVAVGLGIGGWVATRRAESARTPAMPADARKGLIISQPKEIDA